MSGAFKWREVAATEWSPPGTNNWWAITEQGVAGGGSAAARPFTLGDRIIAALCEAGRVDLAVRYGENPHAAWTGDEQRIVNLAKRFAAADLVACRARRDAA